MKPAPPVAFLGVSGRAGRVRDPDTNLEILDALGIRSVVVSPIYPMALHGWKYVFAIYEARPGDCFDLVVRGPDGGTVGSTRIAISDVAESGVFSARASSGSERPRYAPGWRIEIASAEQAGFLIHQPGLHEFFLQEGDTQLSVGWLYFHLSHPLPLTPERATAIRSDPDAAEMVRIELTCSRCNDRISPYAALERSSSFEAKGHRWYAELPDEFRCGCGHFVVDLTITRRNLYALLGSSTSSPLPLSPVRLYDHDSVRTIERNLTNLVVGAVREEELQTFFDEHPLALHICSPAERIFPKARILTKYCCDFAILTPSRELVLVELEKATTKLMTKRGGVGKDLQHAFDQVHDWFQVADDHRLAVLDSIGIEKDQVASIRGIVIAGRDVGYNDTHLRALKGRDFGRVTLLTYDDVLASLRSLAARILESEKV